MTKKTKKPVWPDEYKKSPQSLTRNDEGGANYSAEDLAKLKKKWGIK